MLIPVEKVLNEELVEQCRHLLAAEPWQNGQLSAGGLAVHVKANQQLADDSDTAIKIRNTVLQALSNQPLFVSAALPKKIFPPKFNRYQNGGHYGLHVDNAIMSLPSGEPLRTDLSATLFLSNPDEYEGGELLIETQYGAQSVKLAAGDLILYPSTSLHEVKPVTSGERTCVFFWVESLVRDSQQRELLFDLDQSIQALTLSNGADNTEVHRLSGIYHNLVRRWADS